MINTIKAVSAKCPKSKEARVTSTGKGSLGPRRAGRKLSRGHNICVSLEGLICIQVWKTGKIECTEEQRQQRTWLVGGVSSWV